MQTTKLPLYWLFAGSVRPSGLEWIVLVNVVPSVGDILTIDCFDDDARGEKGQFIVTGGVFTRKMISFGTMPMVCSLNTHHLQSLTCK